jgi:hypothetical protein
MLVVSIGALVLVLAFLVFAAATALFLVRNGQVSDTLPSHLPREVPICTGFMPAHVIVFDADTGKRYEIQGDCPEDSVQLDDDMIHLMEYLGWTVHDDGQGDLSAYNYEKQETLTVTLSDSSSASNQTTVMLEMQTNVKSVPSDFPPRTGSPSPR